MWLAYFSFLDLIHVTDLKRDRRFKILGWHHRALNDDRLAELLGSLAVGGGVLRIGDEHKYFSRPRNVQLELSVNIRRIAPNGNRRGFRRVSILMNQFPQLRNRDFISRLEFYSRESLV